jgi:hypothetical protein
MMTDPLTPETLDALEKAHEAATDGPWHAIGTDPAEGGDWFWIKAQPSPMLRGFTHEIGVINGSQLDPVQAANTTLIILARNNLPALIEAARERDALRAENERLREAMDRAAQVIEKNLGRQDEKVADAAVILRRASPKGETQ